MDHRRQTERTQVKVQCIPHRRCKPLHVLAACAQAAVGPSSCSLLLVHPLGLLLLTLLPYSRRHNSCTAASQQDQPTQRLTTLFDGHAFVGPTYHKHRTTHCLILKISWVKPCECPPQQAKASPTNISSQTPVMQNCLQGVRIARVCGGMSGSIAEGLGISQ